jgi:hypothetical protein
VLILFIVLSALSLVAMVVGIVWTVAVGGQVQTRTGSDVGTEVIARQMVDREEQASTLAQRTHFLGKAVAVRGEAEVGFDEVKALIRAGHWRHAAPILLLIGSLFSVLLFGALAILVGVENKLVGGVALAIALYAIVRTLIGFARA